MVTTIHIGSRRHIYSREILLLQSDVNYTIVCLTDGSKMLVSTTMGKIQGRLPTNEFLRINRQTIINRSAILHYIKHPLYDEIELKNASVIKVSRRRKLILRAILIK